MELLALVFASLGAPQEPADAWTWCIGELADPKAQTAFERQVDQLYGYYQDRGLFSGPRVSASDLESPPEGPTVFFGPIQSFAHPDWLEPMVEVREDVLHVGGLAFDHPRVGVFVRDPSGDRVVYTSTEPEAFGDIFAVATGRLACTITADGEVAFEGEYRDSEDGVRLELLGRSFLEELPGADALQSYAKGRGAVVASGMYRDGDRGALSTAFREGLRGLTSERKVLFVGETHWNVGVHAAFGDLLSTLLESRGVSALFLELSLSSTAPFQHYVGLADDREAAAFLERELHAFLAQPSTLEFLEILRLWNRAHPEDPVQVACHDLEFDGELVLERVIGPALSGEVPTLEALVRDPAGQLERLRRLVSESEIDHPYLTAPFLLAVLENLGSSIGRRSMADRQVVLNRNLESVHGDLLESGFSVFLGGGSHALKSPPKDGQPWTEAAWLEHRFEPTKGRVATLRLAGLGVSFGAAAEVDPSRSMRPATNYAGFLRRYRSAAAAGRATAGTFYRLEGGSLDPIDALALMRGSELDRNVLWLESVDADRLLETGLATSVTMPYDLTVLVLRSALEPMRPR